MRQPGILDPTSKEVHLWTIRLAASEGNFSQCLSWLCPDEKSRAERFHFDRHRRAFVLGRGALRALLASYLCLKPTDVRLAYGPQGKPALADSSCSLRFNTSNSGEMAAYVFTHGCEIGVDIEQYRAVRDLASIAHRFFSPEEAAELLELPEAEKIPAFFNCWTRKEAYIKALGGGLSIPLNGFRVTLRPGVAARMVSLQGSEEAARAWTFQEFALAPEYAGAIAYRDAPRSMVVRAASSLDGLLGETN